jgi:hypothetical protein
MGSLQVAAIDEFEWLDCRREETPEDFRFDKHHADARSLDVPILFWAIRVGSNQFDLGREPVMRT